MTTKRIEDLNYIEKINKMRMRRKKLKVTLKELAEYLGISRSALSQAESFYATISDGTLESINKYLDYKED